jgi:16S rRNA C967 or C1407 C5-methylase (RsmB/RsmF family)
MDRFARVERYRPIIDDWPAFLASLDRPLSACIWPHPSRPAASRLRERLETSGADVRSLPWHDAALRLPAGFSPGARPEYMAGLFHVQEEVSMLPVMLLDPQPGERVLDLCAAPGNKSAQIALAMANRGTVVANDRDLMRSRAIGGTMDRLGVLNVVTTSYDAANYPPESGLFDRVLADVPCSCEGTSRKHPGILSTSGAAPGHLSGLQAAILRKAVQRCRPGGRIVYSTCTYAPEENELVVDAILRESGSELRLLPARIDGFEASPGLTAWKGRRLDPSLEHAMRVWPHQNDTGGFFVAVFEKSGDDAVEDPPEMPLDAVDPAPWLALLDGRFGIRPETFSGFCFIRTSRKYLSLVPEDLRPPHHPEPMSIGMAFFRAQLRYPKLTTAGAMAFGHHARRNLVDLTSDQAADFLQRLPIRPDEAQRMQCTGPGYVLMRWAGAMLGVGLLKEGREGPRIASLYPGAWARTGVEMPLAAGAFPG